MSERRREREKPRQRPAQRPRQPLGQPKLPYGDNPAPLRAKKPVLSLLASFFFPGLGSMINGDIDRGMVLLVAYLVSCALVQTPVGIAGMVVFWVCGMVDAYRGVHRWNVRHGLST